MKINKNKSELDVYSEGKKTKQIVGRLTQYSDKKYVFTYNRSYLESDGAIQLGPDLPLTKLIHTSSKSEIFPFFQDRIPSKSNPAYADYCEVCDISVDETNMIVLLTAIGKRGPSSFVFEEIFEINQDQVREELIQFRKKTGISLRVMASAFNLSYVTLQKIEKGTSKDRNILRLIYIYLNSPEVSLWCLKLNSAHLAQSSTNTLVQYFNRRV